MGRSRGVLAGAIALALTILLCLPALASAVPRGRGAEARDFAGDAFNVLPPGQDGRLVLSSHSSDQIPLYDGLTPKFDSVTADDLTRFFKPNHFGLGGSQPERVELPPARPGLRIERDSFGVPHIYADSRDDVMFGAGWVAAEDRGFLMEVLRWPGRIGALDTPGIDPFAVASSLRTFEPTQQTEERLGEQLALLEQEGERGARIIADIRNYVDGINAFGTSGTPWTDTDVLSVAALTTAILGKGGGDETRRSELLSALQQRLGEPTGGVLWNDLRELQDPETPVSIDHKFHYGKPSPTRRGNAVIDDGSFEPASFGGAASASEATLAHMSNALLVSAERSSNGHPLMVAGPQVGYFYPQVLLEMDLHGGGVDARGVAFPGSGPYVQLGRGQDFAWSATSASSDIVDEYVEELCGSDTSYRFDGGCREMTTFDAGVLGPGGGQPQQRITFRETVHGPVIGYATVQGRRVAISEKRSTRGREAVNAFAFASLNTNEVASAKDFIRTTAAIESTFNWFYADHEDVAIYSSGRLPVRPRAVDPGLPTIGTGEFEWQRFLPARRHPHAINPKRGVIVNWNNKPAPGFGASDSNWTFGSVQRNQLLEDAIERSHEHSLASVVAAMNRAATQDLRAARVLPSIADVLETGPAPNERARQLLVLLKDWRTAGASRLDVNLDGRIDHPGAAIMDAAWPRIADAVMNPVLGPQLGQLASLIARDENARSLGSSYQVGWFGYVDKDLRSVLGRAVDGPFETRFCGRGDLGACRDSLWAALDAAGAELEAAQGPDPAAWRRLAIAERIRLEPGFFLRATMRWTNRPTFQQVISFTGHR